MLYPVELRAHTAALRFDAQCSSWSFAMRNILHLLRPPRWLDDSVGVCCSAANVLSFCFAGCRTAVRCLGQSALHTLLSVSSRPWGVNTTNPMNTTNSMNRLSGRSDGIRTRDPQDHNLMRCHCATLPMCCVRIVIPIQRTTQYSLLVCGQGWGCSSSNRLPVESREYGNPGFAEGRIRGLGAWAGGLGRFIERTPDQEMAAALRAACESASRLVF